MGAMTRMIRPPIVRWSKARKTEPIAVPNNPNNVTVLGSSPILFRKRAIGSRIPRKRARRKSVNVTGSFFAACSNNAFLTCKNNNSSFSGAYTRVNDRGYHRICYPTRGKLSRNRFIMILKRQKLLILYIVHIAIKLQFTLTYNTDQTGRLFNEGLQRGRPVRLDIPTNGVKVEQKERCNYSFLNIIFNSSRSYHYIDIGPNQYKVPNKEILYVLLCKLLRRF
jgi:hypothetical protein